MESTGLFVFPTHNHEWKHNKAKLVEANKVQPVASIKAISQGFHKNSPSDRAGGGLLEQLFLCKGAKVMLTSNLLVQEGQLPICLYKKADFQFACTRRPISNLLVQEGLYNGATGVVVDIIYENGKNPKTGLPDVVMVDFPKYTGPPLLNNNQRSSQ
jgi:hypothetical protein